MYLSLFYCQREIDAWHPLWSSNMKTCGNGILILSKTFGKNSNLCLLPSGWMPYSNLSNILPFIKQSWWNPPSGYHRARLWSWKRTCRLCWASLHILNGLYYWKHCLGQDSGCRWRPRNAPPSLCTWLTDIPVQHDDPYRSPNQSRGHHYTGLYTSTHRQIIIGLHMMIQ